MLGGHRGRAAQPVIDILVGDTQQRLEAVETMFVQAGQMALSPGAEDQVDLLETAPLGPEQ